MKMRVEKVEFCKQNNVELIDMHVDGQREPFSTASVEQIQKVLRHILDVRNHPVLVHCDKGKHRTGSVIGCLRKIQGWALSAIFDEYARFCKKSIRILDHQLIEFFEMTFSSEERRYLADWMWSQK